MSTGRASKLPRKKRGTTSTSKVLASGLPDIFSNDEPAVVLDEPKDVVAEVEARCAAKVKKSEIEDPVLLNKAHARDLHEEADVLYFK